MAWYHVTQRSRLPSILAHGLGGVKAEKNFDWCEDGVYIASTPSIGIASLFEHYLQTQPDHMSPNDMLNEIVVIIIDDSRINPKKMVRDEGCPSWAQAYRYMGVIDVTNMPIMDIFTIVDEMGRK